MSDLLLTLLEASIGVALQALAWLRSCDHEPF